MPKKGGKGGGSGGGGAGGGSSANGSGSSSSVEKTSQQFTSANSILSLIPTEYPDVDTSSLDDESHPLTPVVRAAALGMICLIAFCIRLFAVVRWESVIHEFDPYFNYRVTKFLISEGSYDFLNWLDDRAWYPLGRIVGGTVYPGLMATAAIFHYVMNFLNISINVRNMCVFLAPIFAANASLAAYLFTKEVTRRPSTGLLAAAFMSIVPSYISRSVGGSYDNEGVAIWALVFTFYTWVKAVNTGSLRWGAFCALSYFYMVAAWGGYVFIINIIPIYCIIMIIAGRYSPRLYVAYSTFYTLGQLLAMQVPFVGFNIVTSAESAGSHGVFILIQAYAILVWLRAHVSERMLQQLFVVAAGFAVGFVAVGLIALQLTGKVQWTGRSLSLLDPTYAKKYIPIIASVSEHQPTTWSSYFFDLHIMVPLAPVGIYFLFQDLSDAKIFAILYGTLGFYFSGSMVRLMLTLSPIACILGAIAVSEILHKFLGDMKMQESLEEPADEAEAERQKKRIIEENRAPAQISIMVTGLMAFLLMFYTIHCTYVASEAYSSPSIVLASRRPDGSRVIFDDYREAYYWLRMNTDPNVKVMSWWDYGYQLSAMSNRTVLVDNNTWNNTHIATVGRAMASTEEKAYPILKSLDVDYVLVVFGGLTGYQSDDINKFLWMVRIGGGVYPDEIQEPNYFANGQYRMDKGGSPTMLNCLMYKLCYYRFSEVQTDYSKPAGFDRTRNVEVGVKDIELKYLEEAFTSEHWLLRIYKVKKEPNRPGGHLTTTTITKKKKTKMDEGPKAVYRGCVSSEAMLGEERVYGGGSTGANHNLAKHHAIKTDKKFFAVARAGSDGHAFSFSTRPAKFDVDSAGCHRPCEDEPNEKCGCSDAGCGEVGDSAVPPETNARRWAVYELK